MATTTRIHHDGDPPNDDILASERPGDTFRPHDRQKAIEALCAIVREAHEHLGAYTASDCFCGTGGLWDAPSYTGDDYRNDGDVIAFVRSAVREKIQRAEASRRTTGEEAKG